VKTDGLDQPAMPTIYYSHLQGPANRMILMVRATGDDAESLLSALRRESQAIDPTQAVYASTTMSQYVQDSAAIASRRFLLVLLSVFAGAALLLALIGVYGVIAYSVAQRTRELAIRVALGATAASIVRLISRSGMRLLLAGLGTGTVAALALTRALRSLLFGVKAADPWTYGLVALLLGVVVLVAGGIPARRATRVDPALTLRTE
jgi:ABC-type antimicrobial peptide transport system permease subunit